MHNKNTLFALFVLSALAVVITMTSVKTVENDQAQQLVDPGVQEFTLEPKPLGNVVAGMDFYRQLSTGATLTLQLDDPDTIADAMVTQVTLEDNITTIKGSVTPDGSIVMTVGDKFIHIFLTQNNGIYEFSGKDFKGVVKRTKEMRLNNDIAIFSGTSVELASPSIQQKFKSEVQVQ